MRTRSLSLAAAAAVALAVASPIAAKEWTAVTIGVEGAFPPYNTTDADGTLSGYDIDIANEVCRRAKLDCTLVAQSWDSQIPSLVAGKFDVVLTMGPNPQRREVIDFTVPYAQTTNTFGVLADGPLADLPATGEPVNVNEPEGQAVLEALKQALAGTTIGVANSTSQQQFVEESFSDVATVRTYRSSEDHALDLTAGRVDAVFDNIVFLNDAVQRPGNENMRIAGPFMIGGVMATDTAMGIRKGEPELKAILDEAIQSAVDDGTVRTLAMKWFNLDVTPK